FIGRHDKRAHRSEGFAGLHLIERIAGRRQTPRRSINEVQIAEDIFHRLGGRHVGGTLADHQRQLRFALEDGGWHVRQYHRVVIADDTARRLVKGVDRRWLLACAVFHVVYRHGVDVDGPRQGRPDPYVGQRHARTGGSRFFEGAAVI